jgi:hypothetical protein
MPRPKGAKTRVEEEGAEHISTQDVEDAQLRATLAATHVDELRALAHWSSVTWGDIGGNGSEWKSPGA